MASIAEEIICIALGTDPPLFRWIKYDSYDSVAMRFSAAVRDKGAATAITEFDKDLKSGAISENSINSTGYRLLGRKKTSDAMAIFQLNVQLHPDSWNAYDSLGEAYMAQGDTERAIENYDKSLQLNPKNNGAADILKKLRAK